MAMAMLALVNGLPDVPTVLWVLAGACALGNLILLPVRVMQDRAIERSKRELERYKRELAYVQGQREAFERLRASAVRSRLRLQQEAVAKLNDNGDGSGHGPKLETFEFSNCTRCETIRTLVDYNC